jgi:hypothetical protein
MVAHVCTMQVHVCMLAGVVELPGMQRKHLLDAPEPAVQRCDCRLLKRRVHLLDGPSVMSMLFALLSLFA